MGGVRAIEGSLGFECVLTGPEAIYPMLRVGCPALRVEECLEYKEQE